MKTFHSFKGISCIFFNETFNISVEYDAKTLTKSGIGIKDDRRLEKRKMYEIFLARRRKILLLEETAQVL